MILPAQAPRQFGARNKGDVVDIKVDYKVRRGATFLGRGRFTNAFRHRNDVFLFTHFGDYSKDILSSARHRLASPHLPNIERIQILDGPPRADWDIRVYRSDFYRTPISKPKPDLIKPSVRKRMLESWNMARELQTIRVSAHFIDNNTRMLDSGRCTDINYYVANEAKVTDEMSEALLELAERAADYGDNYLFDDFRPRNLGLDRYGRLVILDAFFDAKIINEDIIERERKAQQRR